MPLFSWKDAFRRRLKDRLSLIRTFIKLISLFIFFPLLIPLKFCPYSLPWVACFSCNLLYCPAKRLRNPILYILIPSIFLPGRLFCKFICPYGTIQGATNNISRRISGSDVRLPSHPLIKYIFLVFVLFLCLDLNFLPPCPSWILPLFGIFLFLSSFANRYWCRLLCPIGAILSFGNIFRRKKELFPNPFYCFLLNPCFLTYFLGTGSNCREIYFECLFLYPPCLCLTQMGRKFKIKN